MIKAKDYIYRGFVSYINVTEEAKLYQTGKNETNSNLKYVFAHVRNKRHS